MIKSKPNGRRGGSSASAVSRKATHAADEVRPAVPGDGVAPPRLAQSRLQAVGAAEQAHLTLVADAILEPRRDENRAVAVDETLDPFVTRVRPRNLGRREACELQELGTVQHARDLHRFLRACWGAW
ncbi:hypothetical protein [uncultured Methylobacterium sp.]|uniref:hypothetical protein n=1 Tax=uncultured Methylobacterium sp. TaxID=157278 RepID=UPI00258EBEA4|nr:hypothetical protein [uncultured Methylobacterium sp.]